MLVDHNETVTICTELRQTLSENLHQTASHDLTLAFNLTTLLDGRQQTRI